MVVINNYKSDYSEGENLYSYPSKNRAIQEIMLHFFVFARKPVRQIEGVYERVTLNQTFHSCGDSIV